uniref:uncharacterized protein LOC120339765 n=1 Tax=Styela clava TaxID=7725 RepID=UPI00193AAF47|nr:uncharacterized protein LOC120339765 [Styela clava]
MKQHAHPHSHKQGTVCQVYLTILLQPLITCSAPSLAHKVIDVLTVLCTTDLEIAEKHFLMDIVSMRCAKDIQTDITMYDVTTGNGCMMKGTVQHQLSILCKMCSEITQNSSMTTALHFC